VPEKYHANKIYSSTLKSGARVVGLDKRRNPASIAVTANPVNAL
jgi:hypothetical protein